MEQTKESFIKGAAILGFAAFISKVLGAVYRIPYQNITGDEGMYVFQQVYPLYSVLVLLATAGFPIAISRIISQKLATGDHVGVNQVYRVFTYLLFMMGCGLFFFLFFGAETVAGWMGNKKMLTLPIQSMSFALLLVPVMASFRGLFQGYQNMTPSALSQIMEQMIRVATILFLSWYCMETGLGIVYAGAGATFGAFTGAVCGLMVLVYYQRKHREKWFSMKKGKRKQNTYQIVKQLFILSLPICLGSLTIPLYALIDSFTVANILVSTQFSLDEAISLKGIYDRGQPLLQFASFFSTALSLSIVPAIAQAQMRRNSNQLKRLTWLALRFTFLLGVPASVGLAVIAEPTNVMLFEDNAGSDALAILSLGTIFLTLSVTVASILQGIGRVYLPAIYLLIGIFIKILGNLFFIPLFDIRGASFASVLAYFVHACLGLYSLYRCQLMRLRNGISFFRNYLPVIGGMVFLTYGAMMALQSLFFFLDSERIEMTIVALGTVMTGFFTYGTLLFRSGLLTRKDFKTVPKLEKKLLPILEKWKILRH